MLPNKNRFWTIVIQVQSSGVHIQPPFAPLTKAQNTQSSRHFFAGGLGYEFYNIGHVSLLFHILKSRNNRLYAAFFQDKAS